MHGTEIFRGSYCLNGFIWRLFFSFQSFPHAVRFGSPFLLFVYLWKWIEICSDDDFQLDGAKFPCMEGKEKMHEHKNPLQQCVWANLHSMCGVSLLIVKLHKISKNLHTHTQTRYALVRRISFAKTTFVAMKNVLCAYEMCARILLCMHQQHIKYDAYAHFKTIKANLIRILVMVTMQSMRAFQLH